MNTDPFQSSLGNLGVITTNNRGHTVEEVAAMATERLVSIRFI